MTLKDVSTFLKKSGLVIIIPMLTLSLVIALTAGWLAGQWAGIIAFLAALIVISAIFYLGRNFRINIQERELGILFDHLGNFDRFLPPGEHFVWGKELKAAVPTHKLRAEGRLENVRTCEGIQVAVDWKTEYIIDAAAILAEQRQIARLTGVEAEERRIKLRDTAYGLINLPPGKVKGTTMLTIRSVIEKKKIENLYVKEEDDGVLALLEEEVTAIVKEIVAGFPFAEGSGQVRLGPIFMPREIEKVLETAYERKLYTEAVSGSLGELKVAIDGIEDEQVRRLADLERLRIMAQRGGSYSYQNQENYAEVKVSTRRNGRSRQKRTG